MLDKTFNPAEAEPKLYEAWEAAGAFRPADEGEGAYCIVIPPPNVTGSLHIGHALNNTLQDVLIRYHRMKGARVLWQPGTDHAGIATQMVVERQLAERQEPDRRALGREAFLDKVWSWKAQSGGMILNQLRRLGASCDWSRERFTMDEGLSTAVRKVFVQLYRDGLLYRAKRLVNWDPKFQTAISDLEVENVEVNGHMWHFKYPLAGGETYEYIEKDADGQIILRETRDYIAIVTTRPETMLGDGAVAVHPDDERYRPIVGKLCEIPVGPRALRRRIPIITDAYPDPAFGSGAVKITGAHDFNDYGVAKRNAIPLYRLMDEHAALRADGPPYAECAARARAIVESGVLPSEAEVDLINLVPDHLRGLDRFEARKRVIEEINAEGLAVLTSVTTTGEDGVERVTQVPFVEAKKIMQPFGDRSGVVIEPMLTDQWFVDAKVLAQEAMAAVRDGRTKITPPTWEKTYFHWLENIEPWCVSRQLWWGHQIPAWYGPDGSIFVAETVEAAAEAARAHYAAPDARPATWDGQTVLASGGETHANALYLTQDDDVLDTWFSSALWPFSTLGWPEETDALKAFYPTSVLVTAFDILFFWVARMMMMGLYFRQEVPFRDVYIHALVRDEKGQKMSKSKGNVIDPLELVDEYGADALRFTLTALAAQGRDIRMSKQRVEGYRNFGTKVWNAARFLQMNGAAPVKGWTPERATLAVNLWIVDELAKTARAVESALDGYRFNDAAGALYKFAWNAYCDWYVELIKPILAGADGPAKDETRACAAFALDALLTLLHPISPFVTEALWAETAGEGGRDGLLITTRWPSITAPAAAAAAAKEIDWLVRLIAEIRSVRAEMNVPAAAQAELVVAGADDALRARLATHEEALLRLARLSGWREGEAGAGAARLAVDGVAYALPLGALIDVAAETQRLTKAVKSLDGEIERLIKKLSNEKFVANAEPEVVEAEREKRAGYEAQRARLAQALESLSG